MKDTKNTKEKVLLIISQVYPPDPAAVGQQIADVAVSMAKRGWRVVVFTANRGYDNPSIYYKRKEHMDGVDVVRFPFSSFGKTSIPRRLLAQSFFLAQATVAGLVADCSLWQSRRKASCLLISTSPPFTAIAGWLISALRKIPVKFWVMDLNPDQMIALKRLSESSFAARLFDKINRMMLRRARNVIVLDRFMAERVNSKLDVAQKMSVVPPWPLESQIGLPENRKTFIAEHGLENKFVIMYSGNHSIANPLSTLLEAAKKLKEERFVFVFVGGGEGKKEIERAIDSWGKNLRSIPYQPLEKLGSVLSAASIHIASIGDNMVGVVHPCKIYGIMCVGRPVITFGPANCHLADLVGRYGFGAHVLHGDVEGAVEAIRRLAALSSQELEEMGRRGREAISAELGQEKLRAELCRLVEIGN